MNAGLIPCEREVCGHRRGLHKAGGSCASPGCDCPAFVGEIPDPRLVPEAEVSPVEELARSLAEHAGRRVCVDVPPGYAVSIELVPIQQEDPT